MYLYRQNNSVAKSKLEDMRAQDILDSITKNGVCPENIEVCYENNGKCKIIQKNQDDTFYTFKPSLIFFQKDTKTIIMTWDFNVLKTFLNLENDKILHSASQSDIIKLLHDKTTMSITEIKELNNLSEALITVLKNFRSALEMTFYLDVLLNIDNEKNTRKNRFYKSYMPSLNTAFPHLPPFIGLNEPRAYYNFLDILFSLHDEDKKDLIRLQKSQPPSVQEFFIALTILKQNGYSAPNILYPKIAGSSSIHNQR